VVEKPTWKDAFQKRHCLVPLTDFIEPIYDGEFAGFMVAFREASESWLLAAGIWEQWVDAGTGEIIESFAIITSTPDEFIARTGHDRSPLFLSSEEGKKWLAATNNEPSGLRSALEARKARGITFTAERFRPMKAGWEKRR
jgi:putative SOS response-associated peptidase YedK